jgi:hypothetical protein
MDYGGHAREFNNIGGQDGERNFRDPGRLHFTGATAKTFTRVSQDNFFMGGIRQGTLRENW